MSERRSAARARTRLRPGKLYREDGSFLCDCAIVNRNAGGIRIRSFVSAELPADLVVLDEREAHLWRVRRVWHQGFEAGLAWASGGEHLGRAEFNQLAGPYYATR